VLVCWGTSFVLVFALGAAALFASFVAYMVWCVLSDGFENHEIRKEWRSSNGSVRVKFDKHVKALMFRGYDRTRAEEATLRIANPQRNKWFGS
jgi:hypothetical protein